MSSAAHRRTLLETVSTLVNAPQPTAQDIVGVFVALSAVLSDLTGDRVVAYFDVIGAAADGTQQT